MKALRLRIVGPVFLALVALVALLPAGTAYASKGDELSTLNFSLGTGNDQPSGMVRTGTHFYVMDYDRKIYVYTASGSRVSSSDWTGANTGHGRLYKGITWDGTHFYTVHRAPSFANVRGITKWTSTGTNVGHINLNAANLNPEGITWDGQYLRVVDSPSSSTAAKKVFTYTTSGTYTSSKDFTLVTAAHYRGITFDGIFFRVVSEEVSPSTSRKIRTYSMAGSRQSSHEFNTLVNRYVDGLAYDNGVLYVVEDYGSETARAYDTGFPKAPYTNYGIPDTVEVGDTFAMTVTEPGGSWKCISSSVGKDIRINNVELNVKGFCAKPSGGSGMEVEIHLDNEAEYVDLTRLGTATGAWFFVENGVPAGLERHIYDDAEDADGELAFAEATGGLADSTRLGFATKAKAVTDTNCSESSGAGFACSQSYLTSLMAGDTGVLVFVLTDDTDFDNVAEPSTPSSVTISRTSDYETATVSWSLYEPVVSYEIERLTAVTVQVGGSARIEYGDPVTYTIAGTQAGISEFEDGTVEGLKTYQYRIRAKGSASNSWSDWTDYVFTGAKPEALDLEAPPNFTLSRDADSVIASWSVPTGDFNNYTLQRQELVVVEGSTFFANISTLAAAGESWLPSTSTMYEDESILPAQTYEYRIAAVQNDLVGAYSDWFRVSPLVTTLGAAPAEFHFLNNMDTLLSDRREFWMAWDEAPGAEDYEVQVLVYDVQTAGQSMTQNIVTDPTYFTTSYGRVDIRTRGRKLDTDLCSTAPDSRCLTEWTGWWTIPFTPMVEIESPTLADDAADTSIMELRTDTIELIESMFEPSGAAVNGSVVLAFVVVLMGLIMGSISVVLAWRRGMAPLGVGMGCAILILILFTGYRLYGTPVAWPVAVQAVVAVTGLYAIVRQTGVFK